MSQPKKKNIPDLTSSIKKLHVYCQEGNLPMIKEILEKNPSLVNAHNDAGNPPLTIAIKSNFPHVYRYLLQFKPNLDLPNNVTVG